MKLPQHAPVLRCIRLVSPEMAMRWKGDPTALQNWIAANMEGATPDERRIWPRADYAEKTARFGEMLAEVERAKLSRTRAFGLLHHAFEQADRYDAWRLAGCPDEARDEQRAQLRMAQNTPQLAAAARLLARHFKAARGVSAGPLSLALFDVMEKVPSDDGHAIFWPWAGWKQEAGDAPGAPLSRLLASYAKHVAKEKWTGGPDAFRRGPWLFPARADDAKSTPSDATAAAFLVSALARGAALDMPLAMPSGGAAHWALAAAYARGLLEPYLAAEDGRRNRAAPRLETADARKQVARVLQRNPGIRFAGWPVVKGDTSGQK